ncbi:nucleolar and spindle-associated protein 1 [Elysia marginata]|uniref:Nucleolar and spindle-associated protein 1 n=1 Tax=Elysia marginata TaxID=1093978 RepID=A0AAV4GRA6_9GAST|nr:nucleolar and spindle-associated protein 1 [Elysia marginata]
MVVKDLKSLKYHELQKLAKNAGIRANQKIDKLIKALEEHYIESSDSSRVQTPPNSTAGSKISSLSSSTKGKPGISSLSSSAKGKSGVSSLSSSAKRKSGVSSLSSSAKRNSAKRSGISSLSSSAMRRPGISSGSSSSKIGSETPKPQHGSLPSTSAGNPGSTKQIKKRRRTFELDEPSLSPALTPTSDVPVRKRITRSGSKTNTPVEDGPGAKRQRRNTFDKTESPAQVSTASPGTTNMIASIDANQDSAERKANLLTAINKKIQNKVAASPARPSSQSQPSQIPRFMAYLASMKKDGELRKPVTPGNKDWTKIHGKEFSKFDSLDVYLDKKQKRKEDLLTGSGKRSNSTIPKTGSSKIARPVTKPFQPTVTSVKNMTFNFGTTPSRQTNTCVAALKSSAKSSAARSSNKIPSATATNRATPFKFTGGNTSTRPTPASASKKNTFDLKASLARPLSWKPHVGKLQPLDFNTSGAAATRPAPAAVASARTKPSQRPSRQAMAAKTRPTNVKDVRRVQQLDRRNNQKYIDMMRRRGLMA